MRVLLLVALAIIISWVSAWITTKSATSARAPVSGSTCIFRRRHHHHHHHSSIALLAATQQDDTSSSRSDSSTVQAKVQPGCVVTVNCRLRPEGDFVPEPLFDGIVLHEDDPAVPLTFVLHAGNYLPGLHDLIESDLKNIGDSVSNVSLDAGWGVHRPDLVATISFEKAGIDDPSQIKPGVQLYLENGLKCIVTVVNENDFTIDANPPLAGASYVADVTLMNVEEGPGIPEYHEDASESKSRYEVATFALGCFWGGELVFMRVQGVVGTAVGYTQGQKENPSYKEVCSGSTGHTEAIAVTYDPDVVSYRQLVQVAMDRLGEDKYLLNQVGNDRGTQYRHGVYFHTSYQELIANEVVGHYGEDCMTEVLPAVKFWIAEDYHQQYLLKGGQSARKGDGSVIRCYG